MLEKHMELILTGHVADVVELSSRRWKCCISSVQTNDDPTDGSPDSSLIVLPQSNLTKLASVTPIVPDEIKTETGESQTEASTSDDRALQIQYASTLPIESPIKGMVTCRQCEKRFKALRDIQNHVYETHHLTWMSYLQEITDDHLAELLSHLGTQAIVAPSTQLPLMYCGCCGESFSKDMELFKHYEEVHVKGVKKRALCKSQVLIERMVLPADSCDQSERNDNDALEKSSKRNFTLPRRKRAASRNEANNKIKEVEITERHPTDDNITPRRTRMMCANEAGNKLTEVESTEKLPEQNKNLPRRTRAMNEHGAKSKSIEVENSEAFPTHDGNLPRRTRAMCEHEPKIKAKEIENAEKLPTQDKNQPRRTNAVCANETSTKLRKAGNTGRLSKKSKHVPRQTRAMSANKANNKLKEAENTKTLPAQDVTVPKRRHYRRWNEASKKLKEAENTERHPAQNTDDNVENMIKITAAETNESQIRTQNGLENHGVEDCNHSGMDVDIDANQRDLSVSSVETNPESNEREPVNEDEDYCSCSEGCNEDEPEACNPVENDTTESFQNVQDDEQSSTCQEKSHQAERISDHNEKDDSNQTRKNKMPRTNLIECLFCRGKLPGRSILVHLKKVHHFEKEMKLVIQVMCDRLKELGMYRDGDEDIEKTVDIETDNSDSSDNCESSQKKRKKRRAKERAKKNFESTLPSDASDNNDETHEDGDSGDVLQDLLNYRAITQSYKCQHCDFVASVASDFRIHMLHKHIEQATYIDIAKLVEDQTVYALNPSEEIMISCSFCDRRRSGRGILRHLVVWHASEDTYSQELKRVCEELKKIGLYMITDEEDHSKGFSCERRTYWHYKLNCKEDFQLYVKHRFGTENNQQTYLGNEDNDSQDDQRSESTNPKKKKRRQVQSRADIKCPKCDFKTKTTFEAVQHLKSLHSDIPAEEMTALLEGADEMGLGRKSSCKLCCMTATTSSMVKHLKLWHKDDPNLNSEVEREASLNATRTQRRVAWTEMRERGICCHCKQTIGKDHLKEHKKVCAHNKLQKTRQLKCSSCDYQAESKKDLSAHKLVIHRAERKTYVCEICGASYLSASGLFTHRSVKHDINRKQDFKCEKCGKVFKMKAVFERHLLTHSNVHLAKCDVCNKVYKTKQDLNVHYKRMHLNIYPYHCERCGHGVQRKEFLSRHKCYNVKPRQPRKCNPLDPFPAPAIPILPTQDFITMQPSAENLDPPVTDYVEIMSTMHDHEQEPVPQPQIHLQVQTTSSPPPSQPTLISHMQTPVSSLQRPRPPTSLSITPPYSSIPHPHPRTTPVVTHQPPVQSTPVPGIQSRQHDIQIQMPTVQNISPPNTLPINIPIMVSVPTSSADPPPIQLTPLVNQLALNTLPFSPQTPIPLLSTLPTQDSDISDQNISVTQSFSANLKSKDVAWANTSWPLT